VDMVYGFINKKIIQFPLNSKRFAPRPPSLIVISV
jgi:hypothetical protein